MPAAKSKPAYVVRSSHTHGRGAFASRQIRKNTRIIEYRGVRTTWEEACERPPSDPLDPNHTFLFEISDGTLIDARVRGNTARWINHSCEPNCEAMEHEDGRVFIYAKRTIRPDEELTYDYGLTVEGRITKRKRKDFACHCGSQDCRGTMLKEPEAA